MSASHASLTDIPAADVAHTDAKWTPVRNHFGITAFGVNAYTARNTGDRLIGEHDHADPTDEQHQELYFVHTGHARFQVDGQDVDAPAGTFVSALDVKTIRSAVAVSDNTVVLVIGAEPGAPYEVTPAERAELAAAGLPATLRPEIRRRYFLDASVQKYSSCSHSGEAPDVPETQERGRRRRLKVRGPSVRQVDPHVRQISDGTVL
jgi:hypothetical protein